MEEHGHYHGFNIRVLYYDEATPKLKEGPLTTDVLLWNAIVLYYHEYDEVLDEIKNLLTSTSSFMTSYFNNCCNFISNEMSAFCNEHKVPDLRPWKKGEMISLSIDEYPIWFTNLEDFIADLTWGGKDKKIMMKEVLPKLLNTFEVYSDVIKTVDFSVKDSYEVETIIDEVLNKFPDKVEDYKKGKTGLINMFFGEVMKASGGKLNAKETRQLLESKLNK